MIPRLSIGAILCIFCIGILIGPVSAGGQELYQSGDYAGAVSAFEEELATVSGPDQAPVLNNIGTCYVALGQPEKAVEYYTRAVSVNEGYGRGWINLGVIQEKIGNPDGALESYSRISPDDPVLSAEAAVKKGTLFASQQKLQEALDAFRSAEGNATGSVLVDLYTGIGGVEFMLGNAKAAEEAFLTAIETDPDGAAMAWTNLGVLMVSQDRYGEAKEAFETAIRNDPQGVTQAAAYLKNLQALGKA